jgi:hypothetical protein
MSRVSKNCSFSTAAAAAAAAAKEATAAVCNNGGQHVAAASSDRHSESSSELLQTAAIRQGSQQSGLLGVYTCSCRQLTQRATAIADGVEINGSHICTYIDA